MSKPLDRLGSSRQRVIEALKIFASRGDERDSSELTCPLCHHPVRVHAPLAPWCSRCGPCPPTADLDEGDPP